MFFGDTFQKARCKLGLFFQFAVDRDFVARLEIPSVAIGIFEVHSPLRFCEHRVVGLSANFGR